MEEPLVSIITPVYNSEKYISETIESVLNQTYKNWEHLIVDDCSTDNSWQLIQKYAEKDERIKIYRLDKNSGPGVARNHAIKEAKGKYIAFLDSDDIWVPYRLERHVSFMMTGKYQFSHSSYGFLSQDGKVLSKIYVVRKEPVTYRYLLKKTDISCLTAVYDQELIGKHYMPEIRRKQDYGLWLAILKKGYNSAPYPEVLAYYRQRKGSATSRKHQLVFQHYKFLRTYEKLGIFPSLWYTLCWSAGGFLKYFL